MLWICSDYRFEQKTSFLYVSVETKQQSHLNEVRGSECSNSVIQLMKCTLQVSGQKSY